MRLPLGALAAAYAASLVVFLALDFAWINVAVIPICRARLAATMLPRPAAVPAVLFYFLYLAGLVFFGVAPALRQAGWQTAAVNGAAYGFFCYATYALTNLAIFRGWSWGLAASDIAWGVVVSAAGSLGGYFAGRWAMPG